MSIVSVYYQTWSSPWTDKGENMDLANLDPKINMVNISFAHPQCKYTKNSFSGTGLSFSQSFSVVQKAIQILKARGVIVMMSVGGATYPFNEYEKYVDNLVYLCKDLGVDGIDIDWESDKGVAEDWVLASIVSLYRQKLWQGAKLSFAGWR